MSESTHQFQAGRRINAQNIEQNEPDLLAAKVVEQGQSEQPSKDSDELIEPEIDIEPVYKKSKWQTLKGLFALSFIVLILLEFAFSIVLAFQQSVILGGVYLTAVITGVLLISRLLWREYRMLRSLKRNQLHRHEANRLLNSEQVGGAIPWLEKLNKHQQLDNFENFKNQVATHHSDKEIMSLYANSLLITQDNQAKKLINRFATESALLVALSPIALVDMMAVLWRGTKLIEQIGRIYGIGFGYASRIKLYRMLIKQVMFVGSAELVSDLAATALSAELLGKLSGRAAQGVSAGIFTARIGYKAMELSRPLPRLENKRSLLKGTVQGIASKIMSRKGAETK
ncbi:MULTISPECIES: TIGR01620 family protein [unclassified Pseudoalteromonas]|jgi:putative membrane protein|uniref:TIGR01620 family protein n=1 Tax=unclassified Pseudoalteromonas TaxID=194690 RepID=UPI00056C0B05|nr:MULTISPECIES: TIGR01620 family protein [unclassified Pseudoalteromonas]NWL16854.1 TIGR01620 family protein [Pseudoalteromonas sp. Scap03]QLE81957.1 TIGR01620 family protein [Pseudoalteromonas sp. Scap25]QLE89901.1 TIGR01620 family protein [Pseudoalteromonas sp. Scap06]TMP56574.1 TIGR01620 family protein [Pseudoalteromonas sp. S1612]